MRVKLHADYRDAKAGQILEDVDDLLLEHFLQYGIPVDERGFPVLISEIQRSNNMKRAELQQQYDEHRRQQEEIKRATLQFPIQGKASTDPHL